MTAATKVNPKGTPRRFIYLVGAVFVGLAAVAAVYGALTESALLIVLSAGAALLAFAAAGAVAYRRLIRTTRQTHRASQTALTEVMKSREVSQNAAVAANREHAVDVGALEWWSNSAGLSSAKLVQQLTVMRSVAGRDLLSKMATNGMWTWSDTRRALESYRMGGTPKKNVMKVFRSSSNLRLLQLGDLCFRQNCLPQDLEDVATLYGIVYQLDGPRQFHGRQRSEFFLDSLSRTGQSDRARDLLHLLDGNNLSSSDRMLYEANAAHPGRVSGEKETDWIASINRVYDNAGLAQIRLRPGSDPAFLRLETDALEPILEGPLVSVIMPVYKPDEATHLAIKSALQQSYQNLEVIVVDDGSGKEYSDQLDYWVDKDDRVTVVKNETNSGAYTSRNIGYERANGKYLTVFDGDDWQHPQKIELLVSSAESAEDAKLISARWVRVDESLFFQYRGWKGAYVTPAHVSALFPTALIRDKLGYWDTVRKAADTEFILRYHQLIDASEPIEVSGAPLTLSLVGTANLSIDDFRLGYRAPDRIAYRSSYEHWHRKIRDGAVPGYLPFPLERRPFPAPVKFLPTRPAHPGMDVLLVADFSEKSSDSQELMASLESLIQNGTRVGVMHQAGMTIGQSTTGLPSDQLLDLIAEGAVTRVQQTDEAEVATVIVKDPSAYQLQLFTTGAVEPKNLYVTTETPPYDSSRKRHTYEVTTVSENLFMEFGIRPTWVPTSIQADKVLSRVVAGVDLLPIPDNEASVVEIESGNPAASEIPREQYLVHVGRILEHSRTHIAAGGH